MRIVFLLSLALGLASGGCSNFERSRESGYSPNERARIHTYRQKPEVKDPAWLALQNKTRLRQLESSVRTKKELDQYSRVLPLLRSEDERIRFLELADYEARQAWINNNNIISRNRIMQEEMHELIEAQDIAAGMSQTLVKKSWGDPEHVEVSGNPQFRNEKWRYSKYISTPEGYKLERKVVYFEAGKVVGWELE